MAKILIAEDDRISQQLAATFVRRMGHEAFVSPHGRHAYEALKAMNEFDILITDIMMPEMDGKQLVQTLRGDTEFVDLPIIVMSAVVAADDVKPLLNLGKTYFLSKPINMGELQKLVGDCLENEAA